MNAGQMNRRSERQQIEGTAQRKVDACPAGCERR